MTAELAAVASVAMLCASGLVAFRWWLSSRQPQGDESKMTARLEALEQRMARAELGRLR